MIYTNTLQFTLFYLISFALGVAITIILIKQRNRDETNMTHKTKLNWAQRKIMKTALKKAKKIIKEKQEHARQEADYRQKLEKELISFTEFLEIETDKGEKLNQQNIKTIKTNELEETFDQAIKQIEEEL